MNGAVNYRAGLSAENAVAREYQRRGLTVERRRWRGKGGEIDLIARDQDALVFVEVKKAKTFSQAAERITPRQINRIFASAQDYCASQPLGQLTEMRFDVALVDGQGKVDILENALAC